MVRLYDEDQYILETRKDTRKIKPNREQYIKNIRQNV